MEQLSLILIGALLGWMVQYGIDRWYYSRSPEYERALAEADRRVKVLELELAGLRAAGSAEGLEIRDARIHALEADAQRRDGEHEAMAARIRELEEQLDAAPKALAANAEADDRQTALESALAEAALRQRALESRLMDVETEIATIRHAPLRELNADADPLALADALHDRDRQIATLRLDLERLVATDRGARESVAS